MAEQSQVNPQDPEAIRREMEETRASLAEKLEVLEKKVTDTVEEATSAVSETVSAVTETVESVKESVAGTVESVKGTVESTVETVKEGVQSTFESVYETLNISHQVERYPWLMVGGSVVVGFLGGFLVGPAQRRHTGEAYPSIAEEFSPTGYGTQGWSAPPPPPPPEPARETRPQGPSWWDQLMSAFGTEVEKFKGVAIGVVGGVVRDLVAQSVPEPLRPRLTEIINDFTTRMGGEKFEGPVLPETQAHDGSHTGSQTSSGAF